MNKPSDPPAATTASTLSALEGNLQTRETSAPVYTATSSTPSSDDSEIRSAEDVLFRRMLRTPQPMAPELPSGPVQRLRDAPKRGNFRTQEEYEEALDGWQSRVGRIKGLAETAP